MAIDENEPRLEDPASIPLSQMIPGKHRWVTIRVPSGYVETCRWCCNQRQPDGYERRCRGPVQISAKGHILDGW